MRAYLDHNATSPLRPEASAALRAALEQRMGNPSSIHAEGRAARRTVEEARAQVAALLAVPAAEVTFTGSGTEAIATAVLGVCARLPAEKRRVVVSAVEHSAVLAAVHQAASWGIEVEEVAPGADGRVLPAAMARRIGLDTGLVALQWANNETGVIQPVREVGQAAAASGAAYFVDAVQAAGKIALDARAAGAHLVAVSAHKLGGPQGVGALCVREGLVLQPLVPGGGQEGRRRGGTEAVAAIAAFGAAAEAARARLAAEAGRLMRLRARIETRLRALFPELRIHGEGAPRLANTVNLGFPGISGESLAIALDLAGFAVSTGSACASGAVLPSHVIRAMGGGEEEARSAVRVSMGWSTTEGEVERFLDAVPGVVSRVREAQAAP
ncbi:MAG TPA: cysteine desulfurase family protein [Candidatus Polarisedimenticolaceae bacterium]|nr:cysteine desulfurase family protein [Candidatus Polarisedimenticolaceae bacterium]